nr:MAG TPA: hypothetical protein [Caudoviricetes sp.]
MKRPIRLAGRLYHILLQAAIRRRKKECPI